MGGYVALPPYHPYTTKKSLDYSISFSLFLHVSGRSMRCDAMRFLKLERRVTALLCKRLLLRAIYNKTVEIL